MILVFPIENMLRLQLEHRFLREMFISLKIYRKLSESDDI